MKKLGTFPDLLDRQISEIVQWAKRPLLDAGINVRTPDGTKVFRLAVDNTGTITSTNVSAEYGL
jgi:hypothetical protein